MARRSCPLSPDTPSPRDFVWPVLATLAFLRLHLLGKAPMALFHYLLPFLFPFPLLIDNFLLGVMRSRKRGESGLSGYLRCLSPNLGHHHLHQASPGLALYPHIFLTCLGKRGVAKILGRNFWRLEVVEDFEIVFKFRDINYLFFLLGGRLWWCGLLLGTHWIDNTTLGIPSGIGSVVRTALGIGSGIRKPGAATLIQCRHGCQNHDLDRRIARFYDPTSPKRLESH